MALGQERFSVHGLLDPYSMKTASVDGPSLSRTLATTVDEHTEAKSQGCLTTASPGEAQKEEETQS